MTRLRRGPARRLGRALLLAALLGGACGGEPRPPDLLLISLDALRADHLGAYGYARDTSPFLDSLARDGTLYRHAFVNTHGTPPSHTTLLTGLYQRTHRVSIPPYPEFHWAHVAPEELLTLPERLRERGYQTLAVTAGGFMAASFGLAQGFEVYDDSPRGVREGTQRLLALLEERRDDPRPRFVFFHTYEIHAPYASPPEYRGRFGAFEGAVEPTIAAMLPLQATAGERLAPEDFAALAARYDEGIRYTDDVLRALWSGLERAGFLDDALVLITSDHGEEFGEHGGLMHREHLYDELLRVPLLLAGRGVARGRVEERLASSVDVTPTLLAAAGIPVPSELPGRDLRADPDASDERGSAVFAQYAERRHAIRTARWKLILNAEGASELYDLEADPGEQRNVLAERREVGKRLLARLRAWYAATPVRERPAETLELPDAERERLRALGYGE